MVDHERLAALLDRIRREVKALERLAAMDDSDLDEDLLAGAKYRFVVAIEAAIDAGQHVISAKLLPSAHTFAEVFRVLEDAGLMTEDTAASMRDAARFRNLLVHGYADVNDQQVRRILRSRPRDLAAAVTELAKIR